ncbi:10211_t:CDS:2 [Funneliformis caledonium]|uniref:10211_t:CDS:1 n=1 Tax=Funneliformis caledonium TaxID=1117310 RepID=A0A9N9DZ60_9GLOM|nr:10211_t:CDS:2 [Funneliformis caledonium]
MTATLRSTKHLQFVSPNFEDVHFYFKNVEAQNWRLKHYLHYRLKQDKSILSWMKVYDDWKKSLNVIIKNGTKKIPGSVRTFCADLLDIDETFEGSVVLQSCKDIYEDFYDQNLEIQISDRVQELEKSLFSSQKISNHFRKITRGKKRSHNDNDKEVWQKRSRQNHIVNGQDSEDSERIESSDDESDLENKNVIEDIEEQIEYPDEKSPMDVWKLPSGITVAEAIHGPTILHKSHPSNLGIIRVGANVRQPEWIQKNDWRYLQASIEYPECPLSTDVIDLFDTLLGTDSLTEYTEVLYDKKFNFRENKQLVFVIDVLLWFSKTVFNPTSAFHNPVHRSQFWVPSWFILSYSILPMQVIMVSFIYRRGEAYLQASANQRLIRRDLKPEDDKPLGLKVDGIFQSSDIEFGMVELSGGHLTCDLPRYLKDHVRGFWGQRDLLNDAAAKFACGDFKIMRQLRTWFLHVHGQDVQVWGMDLPVKNVYRMFLLGAFRLPISWENHHELLSAIPILWNLGRGLDNTIKILEELKKSNRRHSISRSQVLKLKSYIGDTKTCSPKRPKGKKARSINPLKYNEPSSPGY